MLVLPDVGSGTLTHHSDPGAWLKLLGWTTLDPRFVSKYKTFCLLFSMSCACAYSDTSAEYTRVLSTSARPDLVVPNAETFD